MGNVEVRIVCLFRAYFVLLTLSQCHSLYSAEWGNDLNDEWGRMWKEAVVTEENRELLTLFRVAERRIENQTREWSVNSSAVFGKGKLRNMIIRCQFFGFRGGDD
jgi:hypothetical protein